MIYLATDISFTRMGITILDVESKNITLTCIKGNMGRDFPIVFRECFKRCKSLSNILKDIHIDKHISEEPFPGGISSPGLYALDSMIFYTVMMRGTKNIYTCHPSYLKHIHKGDYSKSDSIKVAKDLIVIYNDCGYNVDKISFNNDIAESLIYMTRLMIFTNVDATLSSKIVKYNDRFKDKKEKILYESRDNK